MRRNLSIFTTVILALASAGVLLWLWHGWCVFPWLLWNELRLEPTFLLANGLSVYPGLHEGPVTTWIYGPITPLLFLPATLARSTASALMIAGAINVLMVAGSIVLACVLWPFRSTVPASVRWVSILICITAWPASSFQYIQADNAAVAFGLLGSLLLVRDRAAARLPRWLAAITAVAAIGCKQTAVGILLAQIAWLGWREGTASAIRQVGRASLCGLVLLLGAVAYFGPDGLWLNLFQIPQHIPWSTEWLPRTRDLAPLLLVHLAAPLILLIFTRGEVFRRESPLLLPALAWVAALPTGLASLYKIGGTINSLEGLLLFLPPTVVFWIGRMHSARWCSGAALVSIGLLLLRFNSAPSVALKPRVAQLDQGEAIATRMPGRIWFPWNPLITYFSEHRFDHVEDGLYVRFLAGQPLNYGEARAHLPPSWGGMALIDGSSDWGLAAHLVPSNATVHPLGFWRTYLWEPTK